MTRFSQARPVRVRGGSSVDAPTKKVSLSPSLFIRPAPSERPGTHLFPCLHYHQYDAKTMTAVVVHTHSVRVLPLPPPPRPEFRSRSPLLRILLMMMIRRASIRLHRGGGGGGVAWDLCDCLADCLEIRRCCCSNRIRPRIRQTLLVCDRYSRLWGDQNVDQFRVVELEKGGWMLERTL